MLAGDRPGRAASCQDRRGRVPSLRTLLRVEWNGRMRATTVTQGTAEARAVRRYVSHLIPSICVLGKARSLYTDNAKLLSSGGLHHDPALQSVHYPGSELLQARDLGGNVIGFDVEVNSALMLHTLNLNNRLVGRCVQHAVVAAGAWVIKIYRAAQCFGPESCGLIDIRGSA